MVNAYDRFAQVYNRHWGNYGERQLPFLRRLVLDQLPAGARLLDLCCGTGQLAATLTGLGYAVVGLDGSSEMLRYARENAPHVRFVLADARSFVLPDRFDAVLSLFDSLNHIMDLAELTEAFRQVHGALQPGGLFLCDLNMRPGYEKKWRGSFAIVEDDGVVAVRNRYDAETRVGSFMATLFFRRETSGLWERDDITLTQRAYERAEIVEALEAAGFRDISAAAQDAETPLDEAERLFFLAYRREAV